MGFLHKETSVTARVLVKNGDKSFYEDGTILQGHMKPVSVNDVTFGTTQTTGSPFKFTMQGKSELKNGEKLSINGEKYVISAIKYFEGITFNTTKILLTTEE